jgi:glycosyltransferase involved in cell wall biosynthesis
MAVPPQPGTDASTRIRVVMLLQYYTPHRTGLTLHVQRLAEELVRRGNEVTVVAARHDPASAKDGIENGVRVRRLWAPLRVSRGMLMPFHTIEVWRQLRRCDVLSVHTPMADTALVAAVARLRRVPVVITHHGDLVLPEGRGARAIAAVVRALHRIGMRLSARAIAYSDDYARHSTFLAGFEDRTVAISPPVVIPSPDPDGVARLRRDLAPDGGPLIGFAGRFVREKRPDVALRALDLLRLRCPGVRLAFAGEHQIAYEDTWQRAEELVERVRDSVSFLGLLTDPQQLADFYAACDVVVLPSDTECFGLVQVEAMLCGTPVVMTDIPGGRVPVAVTGMGLLVPPGEPVALAAAVQTVLADRASFVRPAAQIRATLDLDATVDRYLEVFRGARS